MNIRETIPDGPCRNPDGSTRKDRPAVTHADIVADILRVALYGGGHAVILTEAYFDESGSHGGSSILCVAGYIFRKSAAIKLGHEWRKVLRWKKLPYFHMVDCAHGNGPFANLTKDERIAVETKMIDIIKRYAVQGISVTVDPVEYASFPGKLPTKLGLYDNAYAFCAQAILAGVSEFIERNPRIGRMHYFFEAGHESRPQADEIMRAMFAVPKHKQDFRYAGHSFVEKPDAPQIQAADLLAWQWYTDRRHQREGKPRRKDCASLLQLHHNAIHFGSEQLDAIATEQTKLTDLLKRRVSAAQSS